MNLQELKNIQKEHVLKDYPVHKKIYVDMQFFKDIFLGVVLLNIKDQETHRSFLQDLKINDYRIIENSSILFPNIKFGNIAYEDFISNKLNHNNIFKVAPLTSFEELFSGYIGSVNSINRIASEDDSYSPTVFINTYKLPGLGDAYKDALLNYISNKFNIKVIMISQDILSLEDKIFNYDSFFIYDFKNFIENSYYKTAFQEMSFNKKMIAAPKLIYSHKNLIGIDTNPINLKTNADILKEFEIIDAYLNILTDFNWIEPFTLNP